MDKLFEIEDNPYTFVHDRNGKLAVQFIDKRIWGQFLETLVKAGSQRFGAA